MENYDLVGPCGDYCDGCGQYNGLIRQTALQMRDFADLYGFERRSKGAFDFNEFVKGLEWFINVDGCPGCRERVRRCIVRDCCSEKGLRICFECNEFPCSDMENVTDPDTIDRYRRFKEIGFERWIEEQRQKVDNGYEIHLRKEVSLKP
jgi:hypothetical protein